MSDTVKTIGIRQSDGTFLEKEIGANAGNIDGLSDLLAEKQDVLTEGDNIDIDTTGGTTTISVVNIPTERKAASAGGTDLSLVNTGDMDYWNNKANPGTTLSDYGINNAYTKTEANSLFLKKTIKSQTLVAGNTSITFTGIPTSGDYFANIYTSTGISYATLDTTTAGQITVTFDPQNANITVYLKLEEM